MIKLFIGIALIAIVSVLTHVAATVAVLVALLIVIMLHEFGHFLTAKHADMKVTEFFIGFGKKIWSIRKGETEYGVKLLPLGGYVKIIGMTNLEEVDPQDEPRAYRNKPFLQRLSVSIAGSVVHFIIAFLLLWVLFSGIGVPSYNAPPVLKVGSISTFAHGQSPAQKAGFHIGDKIIGIQGKKLSSWAQLVKIVQSHPNANLTFTILRNGKIMHLHVKTANLAQIQNSVPNVAHVNKPTGFVGIGPTLPIVTTGVIQGSIKASSALEKSVVSTAQILAQRFSPQGMSSYVSNFIASTHASPSSKPPPQFQSTVGIVRIASQAAQQGIGDVVILLAMINIFLGKFNMIPMLPFDGGHVAIAIYERIRSRKDHPYHANVAKLMPLFYAVIALLVFLEITSLYLNIFHPLPNMFK